MDKTAILNSVKKLKEITKKRKFNQTFDICVTLKELNLKSQDDKVDIFFQLPHSKGKKPKICALVGPELETKAKVFDKVIPQSDFPIYSKDPKKLKKLAQEHDYFIAQANLMGDIATHFGKVLGPKGKMPNPKAGCIVPPVIPDLKPIAEKLSKTIRLTTKDQLMVKAGVASEEMKEEEVIDNILAAYNNLLHALPREKQNIKSIYLKLTMGPAIQITDKGPVLKDETKDTKESKGS